MNKSNFFSVENKGFYFVAIFVMLIFFINPYICNSEESSKPVKNKYPNELEDFKIYNKYCSGLEPLGSTIEDVKKIMGEPSEKKSAEYVLWYEKKDWDILVYICTDTTSPSWLAGRIVESIDFIPKDKLYFKDKKFSDKFNQQHVRAADAAWDEYFDAYGLVYEIYTTKTPYGNKTPGDLNRISYRANPQKIVNQQRSFIYHLQREIEKLKTQKKDQ